MNDPFAYQIRLAKGVYTLVTFDENARPTDCGVMQGVQNLSAAISSLRLRMLIEKWPTGTLELWKVGGATTDLGAVEPLGQLTNITF